MATNIGKLSPHIPDFVQKHFVTATNVFLFARARKRHEQLCFRNNVSSFARALSQGQIACVASVPKRHERNSGRAKEAFAFEPREKMGQEQKDGRSGMGERKEGNACPQTPRF